VSADDEAGAHLATPARSAFFAGVDEDTRNAAAVLVDARGKSILDLSAEAAALLGNEGSDLIGRALPDLIETHRTDDTVSEAAAAPVCYRMAGRDGETVFVGVSSAAFDHEGRRVELYMFHDITRWVDLRTDLTNRNLELSHLARHDHLTNLFNRLMFRDTLALANARLGRLEGAYLGVLYIDLDGFKQVNDQHGHDAGDNVLVEVAHRLRNGVRTSDVAARLGGDEFGVILENLRAPADALKVARHIIELVAEPIVVEGETVTISASIGAAVTDRPVADAGLLVTAADKMMFEAKSRGRGQAALTAVLDPDP